MPILYLSGPMTGIPDGNFPAFAEAEHQLTEAGYVVISPAHNYGGRHDLRRADYMRLDVQYVLSCQGIAVLPDWEKSVGALLEVEIANQLELPVKTVEEWLSA